jgi:MFS transporter, DHA1 family, solute carrier family 18 (vesicular amine transporter), member 1/2
MSWIEKMRSSPSMVLFVVSFALFQEEFLYGMVAPLSAQSPAHISDAHTISMLYGAYAIGALVATPILGVVTERIGRRRPMILSVILLGIASLLFCFGTTVEMHFLARFLQGAGAACTWTAGLALVAGYFVENRVRAMGFAMLGSTSGSVVGPIVGGAVCHLGGYAAPFYLSFVVLALDAFLIFTFTSRTKKPKQTPWKESFTELGGIVTDKSVLSSAFAVALAAASWAIMEPLFPMRATEMFHASPAEIGILFTVSNLLYAFLAPVVGWVSDHWGIRQTTVLGLILTAIVMPLLAITPNMFMGGAVLCLVTIGYAFTINPTSAELGDAVDRRGSKSYAVAYAVYNLSYSLGMVAVDSYVEFVTDEAHQLPLLYILLIVSGLFVFCIPLFLAGKPKPMENAVTEQN